MPKRPASRGVRHGVGSVPCSDSDTSPPQAAWGVTRASHMMRGLGSTADGYSCTARRPSSGVATARFFSPAPTTASTGAPRAGCCNRGRARGRTRCESASARRRFARRHGWLLLYHGVKDTVAGELYRVGLALAGFCTMRRATRFASTTARPTVPSASQPLDSATCSTRSLPHRKRPEVARVEAGEL